ncbi:putative inner membrane transporter yiJE [Roseovarius sp. THAF9]|uniref:DMT family transporter n=1 Tax=Roseovarius sp. THAF9 TaxID=2587847 RepID=UPI0012679712|nr:DMT family transporter [Roseovarius sp. THAF9]QFT92480.1 putative inner membrane transporter yiJE [Roseovarius sp. THAF9]
MEKTIAVAPVNWLRLCALGMIWGASFMAVSVALDGVGPLTVVAVRLILGAAFLLVLCRATGRGLPPRSGPQAGRLWAFIVAMGLFSNALPFFLLSWGQQVVASGFAGVCMAAVPLLVLPLAHFLVPGERMHMRRALGFVMGTLGVAVLIGPEALRSTGAEFEMLARLACVAAAGCYAVGSIFTRLAPEVDRLSLAAAVLTVAAVVFTPYALAVEGLPAMPQGRTLWALMYLGLLPTGVAQILLVQVIRDAGPVFLSLVNYQVPIWSIIFGAVVLFEALPPSLYLGLALILGGVALSQLGALRRLFGA